MEGDMQHRILKIGRFAVPAAAILALGACFPSGETDVAAVPAGAYGGTVVAYPAPVYYSPYGYGYDGYGYDGYGVPLGLAYPGGGYGYGYAPYLYAVPPRVVIHPAPPSNRYAVPRSSALGPSRSGQYGLRPTAGAQTLGGMDRAHARPARPAMPYVRPATGSTAQPRPRPSFNPPPQRQQHMTPPPPRPSQSQQTHRH